MTGLGLRLREDRLPVPALADLARLAEASGYGTVWVPEGSGKDAVSQLAAHALATRRIRLATGILVLYGRSPAILAMTAATLDELSGGRIVLGLGIGHRALVEAQHGVAFDRPVARARETVARVRAILRGTAPAPLDVTAARPAVPIYLAALGPRMCRLAGEVADGVLLNWATPEYAARAGAEVRRGAARAGRDPGSIDVACYIRAAVAADPAAARRALAAETARYVALDFYRQMLEASGFARETAAVMAALPSGWDAAATAVPDALLDAVTLGGPAERWRRRLDDYRAAGVTSPVIAPVPVGEDARAAWAEAIRTFAP